MNKRHLTQGAALITAIAMLTACDTSSGGNITEATLDPNKKVEITFAGWSLKTSPDFETMAAEFNKAHPNITIKVQEYSADDYDTQMTADLSGGKAPDVFPIKNFLKYYTYAIDSGQLVDLTGIADEYKNDKNIDISRFSIDGKYYGIPYRQDSWVLFYNKTMFEKAGVTIPDGTWTWDDYIRTAEELKEKLPAAGYDAGSVYPTYHHNWQSVFQSFTTAQSAASADDAQKTFLAGDYTYMKDMYENVFVKAQKEKLTIDFGTSQSTKVQYQAQFGTQKVAMLPMGTWYAGTLITQQKSGDADQFEWGMAPVPQNPNVKSPTGHPITFADPGGLAIAKSATGDKLAAAREFVKWASGEEGAKVEASLGVTPAYFSDAVVDTFFGADGMATDELSRKAWTDHDTRPENYVSETTSDVQGILKVMNSSIMTGTASVDDAIQTANKSVESQGLSRK